MKTEWKKYDGTDEQIAEIFNAKNGFIVDSQWSIFKYPNQLKISFDDPKNIEWVREHFKQYKVKEYMLCNPHPLADMITRQAQTGQPVYYRHKKDHSVTGRCPVVGEIPPGIFDSDELPTVAFDETLIYEYSFTPFGD